MKSTASQTVFHFCFVPFIEPLEVRIAPALVVAANHLSATFIDVDGDLVTIKASKPILDDLDFIRAASGLGEQLQRIDFSDDDAAMVKGLNLTITAKPQDPNPDDSDTTKRGDGHVNIGYLNATGRDLGAIRIAGDLGEIDAGSGAAGGIKRLSVDSMGELGQGTGSLSLASDITGTLGSLAVKVNLRGVIVQTLSGGEIGSATVGGSMIGSKLAAAGDLGPVKIAGDARGDIQSGGTATSIKIGRSIQIGTVLSSTGPLGAVKIGGDFGGEIDADSTIGSVAIAGSVRGFEGDGRIHAAGKIGSVTIGRDLIGGDVMTSGSIFTDVGSGAAIDRVTIGGSIFGGGENSGRIESDDALGMVKIGRNVEGGAGVLSGSITAKDAITSIKIGGSVIGGVGGRSGRIQAAGATGVAIGGSVVGGAGGSSGALSFSATKALQIGGDLLAGAGNQSGSILAGNLDSIVIKGSIIGGNDTKPGNAIDDGNESGSIRAVAFGAVKIGGSVVGGSASHTGLIDAFAGGIGSLTIAGSIVGGRPNGDAAPSFTGAITAAEAIGSVKIGGDIRGGDQFGSSVTDTGSIHAKRIASIAIAGSLRAGIGDEIAGHLVRSGAIVADEEIGTIAVKGSIVGTQNIRATIYARGLAGDPVEGNIAIKSLTVGGDVEKAWIFAGVDNNGVAVNGNAQIGKVSVGGNWIASSMVSGCTSTDGFIGDSNDAVVAGGTMSKIASILIKGQVVGRLGTNDIFGFVAQTIGSFKYNGIIVPLTPGASNDTFALGKARPVGASLSTINADGFAVHIVEV